MLTGQPSSPEPISHLGGCVSHPTQPQVAPAEENYSCGGCCLKPQSIECPGCGNRAAVSAKGGGGHLSELHFPLPQASETDSCAQGSPKIPTEEDCSAITYLKVDMIIPILQITKQKLTEVNPVSSPGGKSPSPRLAAAPAASRVLNSVKF